MDKTGAGRVATRRPARARAGGDPAARPAPAGPRLKVWITFGPETKLGDGRAQLLALIDELGSLRQAVARLGMSYRSAWGYLRELERAAGFRFVVRQPGRGSRGGMRLTPAGRAFLDRYRLFRQALDAAMAVAFARTFDDGAASSPRPARARRVARAVAPAGR